ncbi:hypothetical protein CIHG_08791 [Coccidioides immitis H538.4]|uniref:Ribosome biogenesis protein SLX9 n=1 Tax=Coccidioides immitis H538.4 TaxID=396776 RepID=A0A0J8S144_COCIT|nr:hypothetical protein CIHG_08791 [Coccidioides immitis H538.4]
MVRATCLDCQPKISVARECWEKESKQSSTILARPEFPPITCRDRRGSVGAYIVPPTPEDAQVNIIRHKSLKHRPGAMKRKEKLDKVERDRFAKNMAQMATGLADPKEPAASTVDATQTSSSNRWAALRNFISQTIDQNPEFKR